MICTLDTLRLKRVFKTVSSDVWEELLVKCTPQHSPRQIQYCKMGTATGRVSYRPRMATEVEQVEAAFTCTFEATHVEEADELLAIVHDLCGGRVNAAEVERKYSRYHQIVSPIAGVLRLRILSFHSMQPGSFVIHRAQARIVQEGQGQHHGRIGICSWRSTMSRRSCWTPTWVTWWTPSLASSDRKPPGSFKTDRPSPQPPQMPAQEMLTLRLLNLLEDFSGRSSQSGTG